MIDKTLSADKATQGVDTRLRLMSDISIPQVKRCIKCGKEFPSTLDYFNKRDAAGNLTHRCKQCIKATRRRDNSSTGKFVGLDYRAAKRRNQFSAKSCVIYFIRCPLNGRIKIGYTVELVEKRFANIQAMSPVELELIGTLKGTTGTERELHERFAEWRCHGEWFEPNIFLAMFINENVELVERRTRRKRRPNGSS